jgi:predicted nucleic acid-binding protein
MFKRRRLSLGDAEQALEVYDRIPIRLVDIDLATAVGVAAKYNIYAYDAYMLACAQKRGSPLLTLDSGLVHAAKLAGVDLVEVKR